MAKPNVTVSIEPERSGSVVYLEMAPAATGRPTTRQISLSAVISNHEPNEYLVRDVTVKFPGTSIGSMVLASSVVVPAGTRTNPEQAPFLAGQVTTLVPPSKLRVEYTARRTGVSAAVVHRYAVDIPLRVHESPAPSGCYAFWAHVRDLRPGEYWVAHGAVHAESVAGCQMFGYDVGVEAVFDGNANERFPGTDGSSNDHYRIWGKPVYAIGAGKVVLTRNDFKTNTRPKPSGNADLDQDVINFVNAHDGNGNFVLVRCGDELTMYAHFQKESVNPALLAPGASDVREGDFLGLAGNSGHSSKPHLHIHTVKDIGAAKPWIAPPLPMPFRGVRALDLEAVKVDSTVPQVDLPWIALNGRGLPSARCAVWPSGEDRYPLVRPDLRHVAIANDGALWVVHRDLELKTTSDRLPLPFGVLLDIDPGGKAQEVAIGKGPPYILGADGLVRQGKPDGWHSVAGSLRCRHLSIDAVTNRLWVLTDDGRIFRLGTNGAGWTEHPGTGRGKHLCAHDGVPYIIGTDDFVYTNPGQASWSRHSAGQGKRIAADPASGDLWVVGMNDGIYAHDGRGNWNEHPGSGRARQLALFGGRPYIVGLDDRLWQSAGNAGWQRMNVVHRG